MNVRTVFERNRGREVHLLPNGGNCGDGLIHLGFRKLSAEFGIPFTEIRFPRPASGHTLFILGCGNLCVSHHVLPRRIRHYLDHFEQIYLLPCSIDPACEEVAELLRQLPENTVAFCRERQSRELVVPFVLNPNNVHLDHDLAFSLDYEPWKKTGHGTLHAFRTDRESLGHPLPENNWDISALGDSDDGEILLRILAEYQKVYTDRIHVAICAAMLDKEVHLYPGNYHKNRAIFEYSLAERGNVTFHEWPAVIPA